MENMFAPEIKQRIEQELESGKNARQQGLEGRARVCARRAAGAAVGEYLRQRGLSAPGPGAVEVLTYLANLPALPDQVRQTVDHLVMRVTEQHSLPIEADLLVEAQWLAAWLEVHAAQSLEQNTKPQQEKNEMADSQPKIIMYGTTWCYDTRRARTIFDQNNIPYEWIDIDQDPEARKRVEEINHGFRSVPTILFPDGSILVEPSNQALKHKLGLA